MFLINGLYEASKFVELGSIDAGMMIEEVFYV